MFERFTERARQVVVLAQDEARHGKNKEIDRVHLLAGLIREDEGLAFRVLEDMGFTAEGARDLYPDAGEPITGQIPFSTRGKKVLELALREALSIGHNYIGTEHVLMALCRDNFFDEQEGVEWPTGEEIRSRVFDMVRGRGRTNERIEEREHKTGREMLVEDAAELEEKMGRLGLLQMELARRGFFSSVTTFRVNHEDRRVAPEGDRPLHTLSGWNARCNVVYDRFDRPAMDVLTGLAVDHGCFIEWSQKHGVTFYPRPQDETLARSVMVIS